MKRSPAEAPARSFRLVCEPCAIPRVEALLRAQGYDFEPEPFSPFCRRLLAEPAPLGRSLAAFFGYIYIQDRSSMLPPLALGPKPVEAVLDMCASPGSKSGFLAQLTGEDGFVLANEPNPAAKRGIYWRPINRHIVDKGFAAPQRTQGFQQALSPWTQVSERCGLCRHHIHTLGF